MIAYEELKTERGVIDFEDVILILIGLLVDRPDIAKQIRAQYTYFVVDEFQDVSPMQHRLLQLWLGQNKDLCVVGDVSQTIYSFAGANSEYLANFAAYWSGAKQIVLNRDYRSTPQIVELANKAIGKSTTALAQSHSQPQPPNRNSAAAGAVFLVSARAAGRPVSFQDYQDDNAQAEGIAHKISELHKKGTPLKDIAILYRTNTQSAVFETALNAAGISYTIKGGKRFFERPEVINAIVSLRAGARVNPAADVTECLNDVLWQMGWRKEAPASPGASRERWESLDVLRQMSEKFRAESALERKNDSTTANTSVQAFIDYLAEHAKFEMEPQLASVTLSSLHSAKGLEWPIVFLAGVNEGLLPISYAKSPSEIEEERRLFYVGITRAADELYLSYSKANLNGKKRKASQFLAPLWPREVSSATQKRITAKVDHHKFVSEHPADLALYEELRQWRAQLAKTAEKPPYTIFPDTVLRRIAINKPRSLDELRLIKGIGSLKLSRYGLALLTLVNDFLDQKSS
ncbi:ATP-dependent DNA helicase UvrD2 [Arcanobacterium hippocoleae]|uniref:ATP-dependent DNA helicase UvrD2 n=1 Tax=Arcanobacterium hippocoleae TaxID=149017 RepID=UPI0033400E3A